MLELEGCNFGVISSYLLTLWKVKYSLVRMGNGCSELTSLRGDRASREARAPDP